MKSTIISKIKNKLKKYLKDKEIYDVVLFGSSVKGKIDPLDIDVAIITDKKLDLKIEGFHISLLKPEDFFVNPPSLINTLLREGYSLKKKKPFSEIYNFSNKILFIYELKTLNMSSKVKIVTLLKGNKKTIGLVKEKKGEWLTNGVFTIPVFEEDTFQKLFQNNNIKYKKAYILIH